METTSDTASADRIVRRFELEDHGVQHPQCFRGAGVSGTDFEDVGTGIGSTPREALADALELLACSGWTIPAALEEELLAELGDYADAETLEEVVRLDVLPDALPAECWTVSHHSRTGCHYPDEDFESEEEARAALAQRLRALRASGWPVSVLERGEAWEVGEPEGLLLVPAVVGELRLSSNVEEREELEERVREELELSHFLSVRVSSEEEEEERVSVSLELSPRELEELRRTVRAARGWSELEGSDRLPVLARLEEELSRIPEPE